MSALAPNALPTLELLAAFRLASPALPIGGFSYSQGLESAIDRGWISDEESASVWIADCLQLNFGRFEAPMLFAMLRALANDNLSTMLSLNQDFLASRETRELRAETVQMGYSLSKLLQTELQKTESLHTEFERTESEQTVHTAVPLRTFWSQLANKIDVQEELSLPCAWSLAAAVFGLSAPVAVTAYGWSWLENQVMAAMKCVPLGQQAGQRLLQSLSVSLAQVVAAANELPPDQWSNGALGFALASSWHENQYSRMFRS